MVINSLCVICRRLLISSFSLFFFGTVMDVGSSFFPRNVPFQTSVVFLTIHDTWLTTRGRRGFIVLAFFVFFFVMSSNVGDTM